MRQYGTAEGEAPYVYRREQMHQKITKDNSMKKKKIMLRKKGTILTKPM